jgi:hypothetical protein
MDLFAHVLTAGSVFTVGYAVCVVVATLVACLAEAESRRRDARRVLALLLRHSVDPPLRREGVARRASAVDRSDTTRT